MRLRALGENAIGFVGHKGTKSEITAGVPGMLPPRHHGQNAGDDELRVVGVHEVFDGMRLPGAEIERQVRAKTGRAPTALETVRAPARVLMTDGTGRGISRRGAQRRSRHAGRVPTTTSARALRRPSPALEA